MLLLPSLFIDPLVRPVLHFKPCICLGKSAPNKECKTTDVLASTAIPDSLRMRNSPRAPNEQPNLSKNLSYEEAV